MLTLPFFRLFLLIFTLACTPLSFASAPISVNVYLPQSLDKFGKQLPTNPGEKNVFNYLEQKSDLKFKFIFLPWKRAQLEVLRGKGILYGFSKSTERLGQYDYSLPVITLEVWAISTGDPSNQLAEVSDLKGKTIISSLGISHGIEYELARDKVFKVQEDMLPRSEQFKKLLKTPKNIMLLPLRNSQSRSQVEDLVNNVTIPGFGKPELNNHHFDISAKPLFHDSIHFASAKDQFSEVLERIDATISKGTKDGSLTKLLLLYK
jgi:polar amino acid transport system substrate-binding protein